MARRRRYNPGPEGLEGRMLLSASVEGITASPPAEVAALTDSGPVARAQQVVSSASDQDAAKARAEVSSAQTQFRPNDPNRPLTEAEEEARQEVIAMRFQRIERLPAFLRSLDPGRPLPEEAVATIQQELRTYVGHLRRPAEPIIVGFVDVLRDAISEVSVHAESVARLNLATDRLLSSAGVPAESIERMTTSLTELARTANAATRPVVVLTNDYALVLQTALGVGRPVSRLDLLNTRFPGAASTLGVPGASTTGGGLL